MLIDCLKIKTRNWIIGLSTTSTSGAMKGTATFCLAYWLLCLDGHAFVLALVLELFAWSLVERSLGIKKLLLAFPNVPYERC